VENDSKPARYTEAVASVDSEKWISAMQEKMHPLEKNCKWDLTHLPKQKKVIRCKWILKINEGLSNKSLRFKARLAVKVLARFHVLIIMMYSLRL
jgi:hypothetical protein